MADEKYTEKDLENIDKESIIKLFLAQQKQLSEMDQKLQLVLEQVAVGNRRRFGRSSEKMETGNQITFREENGQIVFFNEAEAVSEVWGGVRCRKNGVRVETREVPKKIVRFNVNIQMKFIDFYTNICYTMVSTFKEDYLCIERLWAF